MRKPRLGQIISVVSGIWFISIGVNAIFEVIKGMRK